MNKRIEELAVQAELNVTLLFNKEKLEKFAELIVRECIGKCEFVANMATVTNNGEMAYKTKATADSCATMIKQHFGINE